MKHESENPYRHFLGLLPKNYWLLRNVVDARLEPMGLSSSQWRPLLLLNDAQEPMTQVQIARALGLESPTVVRLLDRLMEKGWVHRRNCPGDRRAYHVELTPSARALCADIERVLTELRQAILAEIPPADLAHATRVMERVNQRMSELSDPERSGASKAKQKSLPAGANSPSLRMRSDRRTRRSGNS